MSGRSIVLLKLIPPSSPAQGEDVVLEFSDDQAVVNCREGFSQ
jgi:hypothetical protein